MYKMEEIAATCLPGLQRRLNAVTEEFFVGGTPSAAVVNGCEETGAYVH